MRMKEITPEAYSDLRTYVRNNWKYVELKNAENLPLIRVGEGEKLTIRIEGSKVRYTMNIKGADFSSLPVSITRAELYKVGSGGDLLAGEDIEEIVLERNEDLLSLVLDLNLPGEED